jgi:hypothetical protein
VANNLAPRYLDVMPRKSKPPPGNPEQLKRSIDMAREVDESPDALNRAFDKVMAPARRAASNQAPQARNSSQRRTKSGRPPT